MITRRGWLFCVGAALLLVAGRLLAITELYALAAGGLALVVGALIYVRLSRYRLEATRELHPPRVHAGSPSRVELLVRNVGFRRSPVLSVRDPFDGGRRWARFLLSPLAPGEAARAAYRLPTDDRGVFDLGPLEVELGDPFGIAASPIPAAPKTQLTVYPRVDTITALPHTLGHDPLAGADHATALGRSGDEFYALRPYEQGDDLRRVHWPSTAKLDDLMTRQDEMPWQGRATVLLDLRRGVHNSTSLEMAVSAAASIVVASWRRRSLVRLVATNGIDSGFGAGAAHVEATLEHLATADVHRAGEFAAMLETLRRDGSGGALAVVTTAAATDNDLHASAKLRSRFGGIALVMFERAAFDVSARSMAARPRALPPVWKAIRVTPQQPFAAAWNAAMTSGRLGVGTA